MKITEVKTYLLQKNLSSSMRISRGGFNVRHHTIVEVHTDQGITGLGEGVGNAPLIKGILDSYLANQAIGLDPLQIESVRRQILDNHVYYEQKGSAVCAASAIEMACWDIKGKALGVPVYELLGGLCHSALEGYVSDIYWEEDPKVMYENAKRIRAQGYKIFKAHIGAGTPEEDSRRLEALRDAVGDSTLLVDLNCGYDFETAARACRLWEKYNLGWIEEPIAPHFIDRMAELKATSRIPIAAGENEFRVYGFRDLFQKRAVDIAMPDIGRAGGIWETKQICALAQSFGVRVSPHNFSSGVLLAATMHLMASTPNTSWLELDSSQNAVYHDFFVTPPVVKEGRVEVPTTPGLGVALRKEILERYAVR